MRRADEIFAVNMKRLALLLLPTFWRKPLMGGIIYAGVSPLGRQLGELREFRKETGYRLEHSGQVCRLRGVLNDEFDAEGRGIRVLDGGDGGGGLIVRLRGGGGSLAVGEREGGLRLGRRGFGGVGGVGFVVSVPDGLRGVVDESRLRGLVNELRLAGMRWELIYE